MGWPFLSLVGKVMTPTSLGWDFSTSPQSFGGQQKLNITGRVW